MFRGGYASGDGNIRPGHPDFSEVAHFPDEHCRHCEYLVPDDVVIKVQRGSQVKRACVLAFVLACFFGTQLSVADAGVVEIVECRHSESVAV